MGKLKTPAPSGLVDIRDIHVDKALPKEERIAEFIRQIKQKYYSKTTQEKIICHTLEGKYFGEWCNSA